MSEAVPVKRSYWSAARTWTYSALLALPVLAAYEVGVVGVDRWLGTPVRNGADALLRSLASLGGPTALALLPLLVAGAMAALAWSERRKERGPVAVRRDYLAGMAFEAVLYAGLLGGVAGRLTAMLLPQAALEPGVGGMPVLAQVVLSLGAGFYEEVVFRGLVLGGLRSALRLLGKAGWGWDGLAAVAAALLFSGYHYVGPYADPLTLSSFTFRFVAGLLFSGLLVTRGFGITVLTHALYDVSFALGLL
jgi:hypothetical protein